ncbi:hypothetical protein ACOME3_005054 [Neoechinorhynchus agilis]
MYSAVRQTVRNLLRFWPRTLNSNIRYEYSLLNRFSSTASPANFVDFLEHEIRAEKDLHRESSSIEPPSAISSGFNVAYDGSLVTLSKHQGSKSVDVKFSVSASIDTGTDDEDDIQEGREVNEQTKMLSRPEFTIDVTDLNTAPGADDRVVSFLCSFVQDEEGGETYQVDEFAIHSGEEKNPKAFSVDCSVLDEELYERICEYLETEFGIGDDFAQDAVRLATMYEHHCYVNMLTKLRAFVGRK